MPANAPHRKLAVELAARLAGPDAQRSRLASGLELSAMPAVQRAWVGTDTLGLESAFVRQLAYGEPPWGARIARYREVEAQMFDVLDRVLIGRQDVHAVTSDVARRIDGILAR